MKMFIVLLVVVLILGGVYFGWSYLKEKENQKNILSPSNNPNAQILSIEVQSKVENYIRENISTLSKEKEVLGGKFYVTKITFISSNEALVEYEDGHIALKATMGFSVDEKGDVRVTDDEEIKN